MSSRKTIVSFCIRDMDVWHRFKELCQREDQSMSVKLEEFIAQYVKIHYPGNPQLSLGKFTTPPMAKTVCLDGLKNECPRFYKICVLRKRFACKFDS